MTDARARADLVEDLRTQENHCRRSLECMIEAGAIRYWGERLRLLRLAIRAVRSAAR